MKLNKFYRYSFKILESLSFLSRNYLAGWINPQGKVFEDKNRSSHFKLLIKHFDKNVSNLDLDSAYQLAFDSGWIRFAKTFEILNVQFNEERVTKRSIKTLKKYIKKDSEIESIYFESKDGKDYKLFKNTNDFLRFISNIGG